MNKKGEMTTEQIVVLIILIASFAVILFFILRLDLFKENSDNICHNSVIARGNINKISSTTGDSIPLDCQREYVCITQDNTCEKMQKPKLIKVKTKEEIYDALANELADCWWMFGEGKINYAGTDFFETFYCALCDQIVFDDSVKKIMPEGEFNLKDFYDHMKEMNMSSGKTYYEYLFYSQESKEFLNQEFGNVSFDKTYYVLTGITGDVSTLGWIAGAAVAVGTGAALYALAPFTGGGSVALYTALVFGAKMGVGGAIAGGVVVAPVLRVGKNDFVPPTIVEAGSKEYDSLKCEELSTRS